MAISKDMSRQQSGRIFRIASYNIRKCVGTDRRRDPDRVLSVIAGLGAEIVALQEADLRLAPRHSTLSASRIAGATGLHAVAMAHNSVSLGWHGNAVLLAPEIVAEAVEPFRLPGLEPRGAVRLELARGTDRLRVVAVHLGLRRNDRLKQMRAIGETLAGLPPRPTLILGDFNEWSPVRGTEPLQRDFDVHAPGRSWHARYPMAPLDRIALSSELALLDAGVDASALARRASDHLPIWAEVRPRESGEAPLQEPGGDG